MATRVQLAKLEQRIDELARSAGRTVDLMGWGDETENEVVERLSKHRPELARTPRHLMRFAFVRWMTREEAIGRGWETGPDGLQLAGWQRGTAANGEGSDSSA